MDFKQLIISFLTFFSLYSGVCQAQGVIIVNPSVAQETHLSLNVARAIFSMRKTHWSDGSKITVFVFNKKYHENSQSVHNVFVTRSLKLLPHQLKKAWDRNIFSGTGESPHKVNNTPEMLAIIKTTPGAIGYLANSADTAQIKILSIKNAK
jgi:ABC-type phosphate transport system substrate-binding protein